MYGLPPAARTSFGNLFHCRVKIGSARVLAQIRAEDLVEENVARIRIGFAWIGHSVFEQHLAGQTQFCRRSGGLADMIRLHGTDRNDRIRAFGQRGRHRKLQLARLVAAARKTGAIVALDPNVWPAKMLA